MFFPGRQLPNKTEKIFVPGGKRFPVSPQACQDYRPFFQIPALKNKYNAMPWQMLDESLDGSITSALQRK